MVYLGKWFDGFRNHCCHLFFVVITMCVPGWLFGGQTFWNEETFWVLESWKREATSILWYLGKWFGGFRNHCCHLFFVVIKMCVPEWLFGGQTIWNEETFWVFKSWKREATSILWYLGKWFGGFRNHCCHFTTMIQWCAFQDDFLEDRHF